MRPIFVVKGPLFWLDAHDESQDFFDVHHYIALCKTHYESVGLGAAAVEALLR